MSDKPIVKEMTVPKVRIPGQKLSKSSKRVMATFTDAHERGSYKRMMLMAEREYELNKRKRNREKDSKDFEKD